MERKWYLWCWSLTITAVACGGSASNSKKGEDVLVTRIAFGSCNNQSAPQLVWDAINKFDPQVFIWMGDNIYGDIRRPFKIFGKERTIGPWKNVPRFVPSSQQEMESRYAKAKSNPEYSVLRQKAMVVGTWDDHDYGLNDAGKEFSNKVTNQKLMLDFLDEPLNSTRRKQAGVYASYTLGPAGRKIKVILLDTRYHRDPLGSDGSLLGVDQWTWLEKEMMSPATEVTIIVSSVQVISNLSATTGPLVSLESWGRFPNERARLFKLIEDSKRSGVFFISGDVHFGEITRYDCAVGYPLYDITSSGLTQAVEKAIPSALRFGLRFLAWFTPTTMRVIDINCRYKSCTYGKPNFGAIEIDWDAKPVTLKLGVRNLNGSPELAVTLSLSELQAENPNPPVNSRKYKRHCSLEVSLPTIIRYRLAILFYFTITVLVIGLIGVVYGAICLCRACKCKRD